MHLKLKCPYCRADFKFIIKEAGNMISIINRQANCFCIEEDSDEMLDIEEKAFDIYDVLKGAVSCNF